MRVICISDTHNKLGSFAVPDGDVLVHAGDLTLTGTQAEVETQLELLSHLPHPRKLLIAGNHDFFFDPNAPCRFHGWSLNRTQQPEDVLAKFPTITYLCDTSVQINGVHFFGSPWTPWFWGWAFNLPLSAGTSLRSSQRGPKDNQHDLEAARKTWARIPDQVQVLITHGPPREMLDHLDGPDNTRLHVGCQMLAERVEQLRQLKLHVFGHIHSSYGESRRGHTRYVNASICNEDYKAVQRPIVIDIELE